MTKRFSAGLTALLVGLLLLAAAGPARAGASNRLAFLNELAWNGTPTACGQGADRRHETAGRARFDPGPTTRSGSTASRSAGRSARSEPRRNDVCPTTRYPRTDPAAARRRAKTAGGASTGFYRRREPCPPKSDGD